MARPTPRPSAAPASSPRPQARPANFDQIVAAQSGGDDNNVAAVASSPAVQQGIASIFGGGNAQGTGGGFNPFNFGILGIARGILSSLGNQDGGPSRMRPQERPSVMQRGDELVMTRDMPRFGFSAGDTAPMPGFSPFSFQGFTSTDPGNVMRNIMGAERNMAAMPMGSDDGGTQPTAPVVPPAAPVAPTPTAAPAAPTEPKPAWWPAYLPWPPAPGAAYTPMPPQPATPYQTSYSGLQSAISGSANPLMLGIGGIVRRR